MYHECMTSSLSLKQTIGNILFSLRNEAKFPTLDCSRGLNGCSLSGVNLRFKNLCALSQLIAIRLLLFNPLEVCLLGHALLLIVCSEFLVLAAIKNTKAGTFLYP